MSYRKEDCYFCKNYHDMNSSMNVCGRFKDLANAASVSCLDCSYYVPKQEVDDLVFFLLRVRLFEHVSAETDAETDTGCFSCYHSSRVDGGRDGRSRKGDRA